MAPVSLASFPLARRLHLRPLIGHPRPIPPTVHSTAHQVFPRIQPGDPDPAPANPPPPRTIFVPFPSPPQTLSVRQPHPSTAVPPPHPSIHPLTRPARAEVCQLVDCPGPSVVPRIRKSPVNVGPAGDSDIATSDPVFGGSTDLSRGLCGTVGRTERRGPGRNVWRRQRGSGGYGTRRWQRDAFGGRGRRRRSWEVRALCGVCISSGKWGGWAVGTGGLGGCCCDWRVLC